MPLKGVQLSLLPEVVSYAIENPPLPGQKITNRRGRTATVTHLELCGEEVIVWADYGSGISQPHGDEQATCHLKIVLGGQSIADDQMVLLDSKPPAALPCNSDRVGDSGSDASVPENSQGAEAQGSTNDDRSQDVDPLALNSESRACGWIGWKESKRERKNRDPWICRQPWLYWEEPGGKKRSRYVPVSKLEAVRRSVYELRLPIRETLKLLEKRSGG